MAAKMLVGAKLSEQRPKVSDTGTAFGPELVTNVPRLCGDGVKVSRIVEDQVPAYRTEHRT